MDGARLLSGQEADPSSPRRAERNHKGPYQRETELEGRAAGMQLPLAMEEGPRAQGRWRL